MASSQEHTVPSPRTGRPMNNRDLAEQLCASSAELRESHRVHLERYGTLIPHLFMTEVLARVGSCRDAFTTARSAQRLELESILAALEQGLATGDRETRNVI